MCYLEFIAAHTISITTLILAYKKGNLMEPSSKSDIDAELFEEFKAFRRLGFRVIPSEFDSSFLWIPKKGQTVRSVDIECLLEFIQINERLGTARVWVALASLVIAAAIVVYVFSIDGILPGFFSFDMALSAFVVGGLLYLIIEAAYRQFAFKKRLSKCPIIANPSSIWSTIQRHEKQEANQFRKSRLSIVKKEMWPKLVVLTLVFVSIILGWTMSDVVPDIIGKFLELINKIF